MICSACGRENIEDATFCAWCSQPLTVRRAGPPPDGSGMAQARRQIAEAVGQRKNTDLTLSSVWVIVPLIVYILTTFVGFVIIFAAILEEFESIEDPSAFTGFPEEALVGYLIIAIGTVVYIVIFASLSHSLVTRQNDHFARERGLRATIASFIKSAAASAHARYDVLQSVSGLEGAINPPPDAERPRSPVVWASVVLLIGMSSFAGSMMMAFSSSTFGFGLSILLALLALVFEIVALYMFYFLMNEMQEHSKRWTDFAYKTCGALDRLGYDPRGVQIGTPTKERSFALYLIVTIFTGGLFLYYWWYVLIKDPNEHYQSHWLFEDQLLRIVQQPRAGVQRMPSGPPAAVYPSP